MAETQLVRLGGDLSPRTIHGLAGAVARSLGEGFCVEVDNRTPPPVASMVTDAAAATALLVAAVKALVHLRQWIQTRAWSSDRIRDTIESTLAQEGIAGYEIVDIKNPGALKGQGSGPCTVLIRSGARAFQLNVFLDGTVITFHLASAAPNPTDLVVKE